VKKSKKIILRSKGKKPIIMNKGGLHRSLGVPEGEPIPSGLMAGAMAGNYGKKAKKQAVAAKGMLAKGRKTAARNRKKRKS
jgi:hypothetical protein